MLALILPYLIPSDTKALNGLIGYIDKYYWGILSLKVVLYSNINERKAKGRFTPDMGIMGIRDSISRGKKTKTFQKLYEHWLDKDTSSTEDVLDDSHLNVQEKPSDQTSGEYDFPDKQSPIIQGFKSMKLDKNSVLFILPTRYFLRGVAIISLLFITLSVVSTILIMRSC